MPDDLAFRDYRPEDKAAILGLLATGRPAQYLQAKRAVFDWQFFAHPHAARLTPFIIGTVNDDIVAINGLIPTSARAGGNVIQACWSVDTYVSGRHRGRGFGKALVSRVSVSAPVMLGFGISDMSDPIFERFNWKLDSSMATMFFHADEPGIAGLVKNIASSGLRTLRPRPGRSADELLREPGVSDLELEALWTRVAPHYPNAVERNAGYLHWRYTDAAAWRYRWVVARQDGALRALLITRHHAKESVVVDYVGPLDDPSLLSSMVEFACADLVASGTQRIRCEANHPGILQALEQQGFRRYRTSSRFRLRSNLPQETSVGPWFIMTGDSDNDLLEL